MPPARIVPMLADEGQYIASESSFQRVLRAQRLTIKDSLKKLYGFSSDYLGIRHAGNPAARLRGIEARDLAALSIMLMGYSPYLTAALETNLASLVEP